MCLVRKEINQFTVTYGLLSDPEFTSTHIHFDLEVCTRHNNNLQDLCINSTV